MQDLGNLKKIVCIVGVEEKYFHALNRWWKKISCLLEITIPPGKNNGPSLKALGFFLPVQYWGVFSTPSVKLDPNFLKSWNLQGW